MGRNPAVEAVRMVTVGRSAIIAIALVGTVLPFCLARSWLVVRVPIAQGSDQARQESRTKKNTSMGLRHHRAGNLVRPVTPQ